MIRWILIVVAAAIVIAAAVLLINGRPIPVDVAEIDRGDIGVYVEERATTSLPTTWIVGMPIDGRLLPVTLLEGAEVEEGEVIARLDDADLEDRLAELTAQVDRVNARIEESDDTRLERSALEGTRRWLESLDRTVEAADATMQASEARLEFARDQLARLREAYGQDAANIQELDRAQLAEVEANVDFKTDALMLEAVRAVRSAADIAPKAIQQFIDKKALRRAVLEEEREEAQTMVRRLRRDLERTEIRSPVAGVVVERFESNRRVLPAGAPVLEIARPIDLQIEAEMLTRDAALIHVGAPAEVFDGAAGEHILRAQVDRIEPQAFTKISSLGVEEQRVRVWFNFADGALDAFMNDTDRRLGVEYRVRVRVFVDERSDVVRAPRSAVFRDPETSAWSTFLVREGRAHLVTLTLGAITDELVEVTEGLSPGDQVIMAPEAELANGSRVDTDPRG